MKITEGFLSLALVNRVFINFYVYPTYLLVKSAEETEKKVLSASVAQALARKVFPVPGGPYNKIPFQGFLFPIKIYLNLVGKMTASFRAFFAF
jgi:hypothetical protein